MKKLRKILLPLGLMTCCLAFGLMQLPVFTPQGSNGRGVEEVPLGMQTGASPPHGGACGNIGRAFAENPFEGWPVTRFAEDWKTVSAWWCDPTYFRGYTHWGIDLAARTTATSWESIDHAPVIATIKEDEYAVVIGLATDNGHHFGMGNHVKLAALTCSQECGQAPETANQGGGNWIFLLEAESNECTNSNATPVPGPPPTPPDDLLLVCSESGWTATYMHLFDVFVHQGQLIERGLVIGQIDNTGNSTGAHLHYQINHPTQGAIDPAPSLCADYTDALRQMFRWLRPVCEEGS